MPLSQAAWTAMVNNDNRQREIYLKIREIDKDRNGFVTELELDDIIKVVYPELAKNDLKEIIKPFCCRENKILIDYKKFRTHLNN